MVQQYSPLQSELNYRPTQPLKLMLSDPPLSSNLENTLAKLQSAHQQTASVVQSITEIVGSGSSSAQSLYSVGTGTIAFVDSTGLLTISGSPASLGGTITIAGFAESALSIATTQLTGTISNAQLAHSTISLTDSTGLFTVTGSPVSLGNGLTLSAFASQSQNYVLAGPSSSSGAAAFRALVAADIPSLSATYLPLAGGTMTGAIQMTSGTTVNWNADTGLSRTSAGVLALGNGTATDSSGALSLTNLTALGAILEVGGQTSTGSLGVPAVVYLTTVTGTTAVVTNATVFNTGAAGYYRISGQLWPTTMSSSTWQVYLATTVTPNGATGSVTAAISPVMQLGSTFAVVQAGAGPQTIYLATSATIGISTITFSGSNTGGVYSYCVTIERLG